jgi:NTP pyrophosphatase (non-canonical NTP hydrolase)
VDAASTAARGLEGKEVSENTQAKALEVFGADRQVDKCIEELGELATVLVKYRHGEATAEQVIDELADVAITTGTLWLLFDRAAIQSRVAVKLSRLSRLVADQVAREDR